MTRAPAAGATIEVPIDRELWERGVRLRRDLHQHPELRFQEARTAATVASELRQLGLEVREGIAGTGIVATLRGGPLGRRVLVRADMDALPLADLTTGSYRSENDGVAHACGHDVHVAVAVVTAALLARVPDLAGEVSFVFQPAEEIPFGASSGAHELLREGLLEQFPGDAIVGLHCWPDLPAGTVGIDPELAMATKDAFQLLVRGQPTHAALPSRGRDALLAAAQAVVALHTLVARRVDPDRQAALNVGTIHGGSSQSVVPSEVELTGTIRTLDERVRRDLKAAVEQVAAGVATAAGAECSLRWANEMPAVRNDPGLVEAAFAVLATSFAGEVVRLPNPPMTADDFALFAERIPGLYLKLGVAGPDGCAPLHSSTFDVDERCIAFGAHALSALVRHIVAG